MIEKLPDVPFGRIFVFLSYADRFSLRRACKMLKSLVDRQANRNLFVFFDCYPFHQYLFETHELVYYSDSCRVLDFDRFISNKEKFKLIKKLTIYFEGLQALNVSGDFFHCKHQGSFRRETSWRWEINLEHLDFFKSAEHLEQELSYHEAWRMEINLEHLNFFENVEHLELKGIGSLTGRLGLKNLKILSVATRRRSEFDLQCSRLRALCISFGARPNFSGHLSDLDYLSIGRLRCLSYDSFGDYLTKLFKQCPKLSTIGFEDIRCLWFTLWEMNDGCISLPLWTVIRLERTQRFLHSEVSNKLVQYKKSIEPKELRIIFNDELISLEEFLPINRFYNDFERYFPSSFKLHRLNKTEVDLSYFLSGLIFLALSDDIEEDLVMKLKNLRRLDIKFVPSRGVGERLFGRMLPTCTRLKELRIENPSEQIALVLQSPLRSSL